MLDNILEDSVDQHFHALIETRNFQRRQDVVDDNLTAEVVEEMGESMWDPPEVQINLSCVAYLLQTYYQEINYNTKFGEIEIKKYPSIRSYGSGTDAQIYAI